MSESAPAPQTPEERRKAAWVVFEYEREMYLDLHTLLKSAAPAHLFSKTLRNALTESLVLHANILCEMLTWRRGSAVFCQTDLCDGLAPPECTALKEAFGSVGDLGSPAHAFFRHMMQSSECRGGSFDYEPLIDKIHEPLLDAMGAVIHRKNVAEAQAKEAAEKERFEETLDGGDESVQATTEEGAARRFVPVKRHSSFEYEYVDAEKVVSVGQGYFTSSRGHACPATMIRCTDGVEVPTSETPEEVVAKLQGRAP